MEPSSLQVAQYNELKSVLNGCLAKHIKEILVSMRLSSKGNKEMKIQWILNILDKVLYSKDQLLFHYIRKRILEIYYGASEAEKMMKNDGIYSLAKETGSNKIYDKAVKAPWNRQKQIPLLMLNGFTHSNCHSDSQLSILPRNTKYTPSQLYHEIPYSFVYSPNPFYNIIEIATKPKFILTNNTREARICFEMPVHILRKLEKTIHLVEKFISEDLSPPDFDIIAEPDSEHPELKLNPKEAPIPAIYSLYLFCIPSGKRKTEKKNVFPTNFEVKINDIVHKQTPLLNDNHQRFHPLDLTPYIIEKKDEKVSIAEIIHLHMKWSDNNLKITFLVYLVHKVMPQTLYSLLLNEESRFKPRSQVIKEFLTKKKCDLEIGNLTISLKCPLAYTPIRLPVRGSHCKHLQCFDLWNFLLINQESNQFSCPVCHKSISGNSYSVAVNEKNQCFVFPDRNDVGKVSLFKDRKPPECENSAPYQLEIANEINELRKYYLKKPKESVPLTTGLQVCGFFTEIIYQIRKSERNFENFSSVSISENGDYTLLENRPTTQNIIEETDAHVVISENDEMTLIEKENESKIIIEDVDQLITRKRIKLEIRRRSSKRVSEKVEIDLTAEDELNQTSFNDSSNVIVISSSDSELDLHLSYDSSSDDDD